MSFEQWLALYRKANFNETRVSLLSYLEQGMIVEPHRVESHVVAHNIINNILKRVYKLA